jgi:hypothetical protein
VARKAEKEERSIGMTQYEVMHMENLMVRDDYWDDNYNCSDEPEYEEEYGAPYDYGDDYWF